MRKEKPRKEYSQSESNLSLKIGVANLILTAIVGIGVALYINHREEALQRELVFLQAKVEEETQREMLKLQSEIEQKNSVTQLEVEDTCMYIGTCSGSLAVSNQGTLAAEDVRIVVTLQDISEDWRGTIDDIGWFNLTKLPATLGIESQEQRVDVLYPTDFIDGNNAIMLTVSELPVGSEVDLVIQLKNDSINGIDFTEQLVTRKATLYLPKSDEPIYFSHALQKFFENYYSIARFSVESACDNCEGVRVINDIYVSRLGTWGYGLYPSPDEATNQMIGKTWILELTLNLRVPEGIQSIPDSSDLYLQLVENSDGSLTFLETQQNHWIDTSIISD